MQSSAGSLPASVCFCPGARLAHESCWFLICPRRFLSVSWRLIWTRQANLLFLAADSDQPASERIHGESLTGKRYLFDADELEHGTGCGKPQTIDSAIVVVGGQQRIVVPESTRKAVPAQLDDHFWWVCPAVKFVPVVIEAGKKCFCIVLVIASEVAPPFVVVTNHPRQVPP